MWASCKIEDNGLEWLLRFMFQFFQVIGITCKSKYLCQMALVFPSSLYLLQKFVNLKRDTVKYSVCPNCSSLYDLETCARKDGGRIVSNIWTSIPFKRRQKLKGECREPLARKVILNSSRICFYPFRVYCFNNVIDQLLIMSLISCKGLLKRPGVAVCEQWREH